MSVLVVAEHDNQQLKLATQHVVTAAKQLSDQVIVLVAGHQCASVVAQAQCLAGVQQVLHADDSILEHGLAEAMQSLIMGIDGDFSHILAPATTFGKNLMPRVAISHDVAQISDVIEIIDADTFKRPIYAGNALATVKSLDALKVITVRITAFEACDIKTDKTEVCALEVNVVNELSEYVKDELSGGDRPELNAAQIVVSGGRGLQNKENFTRLEAIADRLGAAVGASRAAVDAGFAPNDYQVGQTGQVVAPQLYIAVGISGAIQHLAGMKDSKIIVAINKDPDAPIFEVADYGLVADLADVFPEWESTLTEMGL